MHLALRLLAALAFFSAAYAEDPATKSPRYEMREVFSRDGINKFYLGRQIAHVMGHQAAGWLERPEREEEEKTSLLIDALKFREGEVVADVGTGTGYIAEKIARKVGASGVVFGTDIQQEMLDQLERKMRLLRLANVKGVLGTERDTKLPAASCDTIIMVDVYHEFEWPWEMARSMIAALKPGGRLVFVEFRGEDEKVPIKEVHKMSEAQIKKEMAAHPEIAHAETLGVLPWQHIVVFRKKGDAAK